MKYIFVLVEAVNGINRTINIKNECPFTVWPGVVSGA